MNNSLINITTILTWNLQHGGSNRLAKIISVLKNHQDATVIILTEFRNTSKSELIKKELFELGFTFQYFIEANSKTNTVFIASKQQFVSFTFPELKEHAHRVIKIVGKEFSIYGCYFPGQDEKKYVFDFLLNEIRNNPKENIIITGDINTGKHYLDEKGKTFFHSGYFDKLESLHFIDAFRFLHKDKIEFSWYSNKGNGFRLDHFFVSPGLVSSIKRCEYLHDYRENKITDHSMMVLELGG